MTVAVRSAPGYEADAYTIQKIFTSTPIERRFANNAWWALTFLVNPELLRTYRLDSDTYKTG